MPSMDITTNIGCCNVCVYCPQERSIRSYRMRSDQMMMTFDTFVTCLNKIPKGISVNFSGRSEPWLNPDCSKMLLYAYQQGYSIHVYTSLVGMTPADIDLLEPIPFGTFNVHLPAREGYDHIRVDEKYLAVLARLRESAIKPIYTVIAGTVRPEVKVVLGDRCPSETRFFPLGDVTSIAGNVDQKIKPRIKRLGALACMYELNLNSLLPNGDVVLCCVDFSSQHLLGNLLTSDYSSLFTGQEFLKVKQGLLDDSRETLCRYCERTRNIGLLAKLYNPPMVFIRQCRSPELFWLKVRRFFQGKIISRFTRT